MNYIHAFESFSYFFFIKFAELNLVFCRNFGKHGHITFFNRAIVFAVCAYGNKAHFVSARFKSVGKAPRRHHRAVGKAVYQVDYNCYRHKISPGMPAAK